MSIFRFLGPSLAFIRLLHYECIGTHLIEENTGKEVHDSGLDPLDLFVSILRYLRQSSHTAPSFLPSPPLFRQTVCLPSPTYFVPTAPTSMLSLASGSVPFFGPWMHVQLYMFEVFLFHRFLELHSSFHILWANTLTKATHFPIN